jgi:hypothetical protein
VIFLIHREGTQHGIASCTVSKRIPMNVLQKGHHQTSKRFGWVYDTWSPAWHGYTCHNLEDMFCRFLLVKYCIYRPRIGTDWLPRNTLRWNWATAPRGRWAGSRRTWRNTRSRRREGTPREPIGIECLDCWSTPRWAVEAIDSFFCVCCLRLIFIRRSPRLARSFLHPKGFAAV